MFDFYQLSNLFSTKDAHLTVSFGFDNKYLDYGKILLRSIQKNSPNIRVKALAINVPESSFDEFSGYDNIEIIHENKQFEHPYEQRLYSIVRRIFLIHELRHDPTVENLLQLDADLIVRHDLNRFGRLFEQGDMCLTARLKMKHEALRLMAGILGLSNTPAAKALTQEWITQLWNLLEEPQDSKYIDQLTLWKAYEKVQAAQGLKIVNLQAPYIGRTGNTAIRVFAATKDARGDKQLLKELNQYADKVLDDAPSNAPKQPEQKNIFLERSLVLNLFKTAGFAEPKQPGFAKPSTARLYPQWVESFA
ncbi:MAG: hypothetical protein KME16_11620 [Scytolyngbya sp. HA4215-MV1]|jgi:hypothetical protein|nr:hypothetical protein [Scytolyngbya sp. HA4215-MV1]